MTNLDKKNRDEIRNLMQSAIKDGDSEAFANAFQQMMNSIEDGIKQEYDGRIAEMQQELDGRILSARGVRQLTSAETGYYQKVIEAMKSTSPKQAIENIDVAMPETIVESVFEDLRTNHPLLSEINFIPTTGKVKLIINTNGEQKAVWGALTAPVVQELMAGFKEIDASLMKISAFLPVSKACLDLGPQWLDRFVRETLYEALACGMEYGIVSGTGKDMPIGMIRQVGDGVSVKDGVYPEKEKITVTDFTTDTVGNLLSLLATDPSGKHRTVSGVILLCNPADYLQKVMPATTVLAPDGTYRNDVMPYPMKIIQTCALKNGEAVMGLSRRYFMGAGTEKSGRLEYSDEYKFVEDERVYLIKAYANGMPKDNNAFLHLDISKLRPLTYRVEQVTPAPTPSTDATLLDLKIGSLTLSPTFESGTTSYTASTTNASNVITTTPSDAGAEIAITVADADGTDSQVIENGTSAKWYEGENTVTVKVTAADGTTTKEYTVTVTKS